MPKKNNGLVMFCLLLCVCFGLAGYTIAVTPVYDQRDVAVINRLIEENDLDRPKNAPNQWDDIHWTDSKPKRIEWMWLHTEQPIKVADLSELSYLRELIWSSNGIDTLILPGNVQQVYCSANQLKRIDCSKATNLRILQLSHNQLTKLDVSGLLWLENLEVEGNQLTELTIQNLPQLESLNCMRNQLIELNLSGLPALHSLLCNGNQLEQLNFDRIPDLKYLDCSENRLRGLDMTQLINLTTLECGYNQLEQLTVQNLTRLEKLDCSNNPLEQLRLVNLPVLRSLNCGERGRLSLDGSMQLTKFDYATRTAEVTVHPPEGKYLSSCQGLPKDAQINGNTIRFSLTYQTVSPEPFYLSEDLRS